VRCEQGSCGGQEAGVITHATPRASSTKLPEGCGTRWQRHLTAAGCHTDVRATKHRSLPANTGGFTKVVLFLRTRLKGPTDNTWWEGGTKLLLLPTKLLELQTTNTTCNMRLSEAWRKSRVLSVTCTRPVSMRGLCGSVTDATNAARIRATSGPANQTSCGILLSTDAHSAMYFGVLQNPKHPSGVRPLENAGAAVLVPSVSG
jgi:hypothetical protein